LARHAPLLFSQGDPQPPTDQPQPGTTLAGPAGRPPHAIDPDLYREAMSCLAAPIAIVTCCHDGRNWGLTASSVAALSLTPPLVSVAIARTASCHKALTSCGEFMISVLTARHRDLAVRFAASGVDRFADGGMAAVEQADIPVVAEAGAQYRCARWDVLPVGDHDLLVGLVTDVSIHELAEPLVWYRRAFCTAVRETAANRCARDKGASQPHWPRYQQIGPDVSQSANGKMEES
jgi:flavin reductase ActVB